LEQVSPLQCVGYENNAASRYHYQTSGNGFILRYCFALFQFFSSGNSHFQLLDAVLSTFGVAFSMSDMTRDLCEWRWFILIFNCSDGWAHVSIRVLFIVSCNLFGIIYFHFPAYVSAFFTL
jgi:hypothetical protein